MRKAALIVTAIVGITLATSLVFRPRVDRTLYQGRTAEGWIHELGKAENGAQAREVLREIGTNALPALIHDLRSNTWMWRAYVKVRLSFPRLLGLLPDPDISKDYRRNTVIVLIGRLGSGAAEAVPDLEKAIGDDDPKIRAGAAMALRNIGQRAYRALNALIRALTDGDPTVRACAAEALGQIGPSGQSAIPSLEKALGDPDETVRFFAAQSLGQIKEASAAK